MAGSSTSLCYPREARLLRPQDFTALRGVSKRISLRYFSCEYRSTDRATARLGMAVSRRVSKLAVVRNRIRRQIRESFRLQRGRLPHCDLLVIARTLCAETDNKILRAELEQLWNKLAALSCAEATSPRANVEAAAPLPLNATEPPGTMRAGP
jgi:ribonuclease P protein component